MLPRTRQLHSQSHTCYSRAQPPGLPGTPCGDRNPTSRSGLLSAVLVPRDSGPAFFLHSARLPGLADTHYHRPPAPLALRFPPAAGGSAVLQAGVSLRAVL